MDSQAAASIGDDATPQLGSIMTSTMEATASQPGGHRPSKSITSGQSEQDAATRQLFLYTKLNQNQTKSLKKAGTNVAERRVLAEIFGLKSITNLTPNDSPSKVELLKLDFHYMNYMFCKKYHYSNEKVSTMLAILDFVFHRMLEKQLKPEVGLKLLKDLLANHSIQRPPYRIFIFSDQEVLDIVNFSMTTFLRHFSLYEFAFKPRVELVLRQDPIYNTRFNAPLMGLDQMVEVEEEEAKKMKNFLKQMNLEKGKHTSQMTLESIQGDDKLNVDMPGLDSRVTIEQDGEINNPTAKSTISAVSMAEKRRLGRAYQKGKPLEEVVAAEMTRIRQAFDVRLGEHTEDLVAKIGRGESIGDQTSAMPKKK